MDTVAEVHALIDRDLKRIARYFKPGAKLTLVVRHPTIPSGSADMVLTDDDTETAIIAIRRLYPPPAVPVSHDRNDMPEPPLKESGVKKWHIGLPCACGHRHGDGIIASTRCPRRGCGCTEPTPPPADTGEKK